jgi:hypothetical protein
VHWPVTSLTASKQMLRYNGVSMVAFSNIPMMTCLTKTLQALDSPISQSTTET